MSRKTYHHWLTPDGLDRIEGWARDGLTNEQIAKNIGVTRETFQRWLKQYPSMRVAVENGSAPIDLEVENALLKSALGFEYEETKAYQVIKEDGSKENRVERLTRYALPNVTAQIFWLKNRKPDQWQNIASRIKKKQDAELERTKAQTEKLTREAEVSANQENKLDEYLGVLGDVIDND